MVRARKQKKRPKKNLRTLEIQNSSLKLINAFSGTKRMRTSNRQHFG
jgi:hypothetical protein